jgi:hypothetical protein
MENVQIDNADPTLPPTIHIQFQCLVTFELVSVHDKIKRLLQEAPSVYGFADGENNWRFLSELPIFWELLLITTMNYLIDHIQNSLFL